MLVLTRQRDDSIMIGEEIEVKIVDIRGDKVRLGITAPRKVAVHRKEIYEQIRQANEEAARVQPEDLLNIPAPEKNEPFPRLAAEHKDLFLLAAIDEAQIGLAEG